MFFLSEQGRLFTAILIAQVHNLIAYRVYSSLQTSEWPPDARRQVEA